MEGTGKAYKIAAVAICGAAICIVALWFASPVLYEARGEFAYCMGTVPTNGIGKVLQSCANGNKADHESVRRLLDDCTASSFASNVLVQFLSEYPTAGISRTFLERMIHGSKVIVSELPIPVLTVCVWANDQRFATELTRSYLLAVRKHVDIDNKKRHEMAVGQIHEQIVRQSQICEKIKMEQRTVGISDVAKKSRLAKILSEGERILADMKNVERTTLELTSGEYDFKVHLLNNGETIVKPIGKLWFHFGHIKTIEACPEWKVFEKAQRKISSVRPKGDDAR